jgi:uncharacterized YigZ family protein
MLKYKIPTEYFQIEDEIKKSKFITHITHTTTLEQSKEFIAQIKSEHPTASHNCWAFNYGIAGDSARVGMSDDGEPQGTAGKPMLNALMHSDIGEITVVITRYFGGTKLGAGGLVRAYSAMTVLGLENAPTILKIEKDTLLLQTDYNYITVLKRLFEEFSVEIENESFTDKVEYLLKLPKDKSDSFISQIVELTYGKAVIKKV